MLNTLLNFLKKRILTLTSPFEKILQLKSASKFLFIIFLLLGNTSLAQKSKEVIIPGVYEMPETKVHKKKKIKEGVRVDLHRFMGYEQIPSRYLSLPYDTFQNTNNTGTAMTGISFLLLMLLPLLFLFPGKFSSSTPLTNVLTMALCLLMLVISIPSALLNQNKFTTIAEAQAYLQANPSSGFLGNLSDEINMNLLNLYQPIHDWFSSVSGKSDSITYPILFGLFFALLYLIYRRTANAPKVNQTFLYFLGSYFFLWWILGSGGAWYGMLLFCLPFIFLVKGMKLPEVFSLNNSTALVDKAGILFFACGFWMFLAFTYRAANYYPVNTDRTKHIYIPPFIEYQVGNLSKAKLYNASFPNSVAFEKVINQTDGLVYRVGTQLNFFIEENDRRVYSDTFLDFFHAMVKKFKHKKKIMRALKARGFEYIVFDLNLAINDQTPDKSLTKRFTNFMNSLYDNPHVELLLTDRTLKMDESGKIVNEVIPINGTIVEPGRIAVFRIK